MKLLYWVFACSFACLCSCDQAPSDGSKPKLLSSEALSISPRTCGYSRHDYAYFSCFDVDQKRGLKHEYQITIIQPKTKDVHDWQSMIVSIPGGPGQGDQTSDLWVKHWADWMQKAELTQPLLLFEPFATKGSSTFWRCKNYEQLSLSSVAKPIALHVEVSVTEPVLIQCLFDFNKKLKNDFKLEKGLAQINSEAVAEGLRLLLDALPSEAVHLLGTSYGTRVALLAADHPRVVNIVLDSPYPFDKGTLMDWPNLLGRAFTVHERELRAYEGMGMQVTEMSTEPIEASFYRALFDDAYQYLQGSPQNWRLERWDGQKAIQFSLTADRLLALHYHVLYDESLLPYFYQALKTIRTRPDELRWLLEDFVTTVFDPTFSTLIYMAIECNDNQVVSRSSFLQEAKLSGDVYTDWQFFYDSDICQHAIFERDAPIQLKEYTQKPSIIMSGELDPVTPAEWGGELNKRLNLSEFYFRPGVGHAVLSAEQCLLPRLRQFWSVGHTRATDTAQYQHFRQVCVSQ